MIDRFTQPRIGPDTPGSWGSAIADDLHEKALSGRLDRLDNLRCITEYAQPFQSSRANLVIVLDAQPEDFPGMSGDVVGRTIGDYSLIRGRTVVQAFYWLCSDNLTIENSVPSTYQAFWCCEEEIPRLKANAENWMAFGNRVKYCLSEPAPDRCRLYFNSTIAILVNAVNIMKLVVFLLVFSAIREQPLLTIGDAVKSFIEDSDETTRGLGLVGRADFVSYPSGQWPARESSYDTSRKRWFVAAGRHRITFAVLL